MLVDAAYKRIQDRMEMITDQIQTDELRCYLTGRNNFREDIATYQRYKGNRYDKNGNRIIKQPEHLKACRQYLIDNYNAAVCDGQEADDALGIAKTKCNANPDWHSIISTVDKDLLIIPGLHHDMNSGYIQTVDRFGSLGLDVKGKLRGTGLKFFYAQLLMGDSADWIPGLPKVTPWMKEQFGVRRLGGCGPAAALSVLDTAEDEFELYSRVLSCYASYWDGDTCYLNWRTGNAVYPEPEQMLLEQARLLWIRQTDCFMWDHPEGFLERWTKQQ
jgi:5'-3' exonuclease